MRWMLVVVLWVLLMAGVAGAESWNDGCNACIGQRNGMYHCTAIACLPTGTSEVVLPVDRSECELKMEAAMEAMELNTWIVLNRDLFNVLHPIPDTSVWIVIVEKENSHIWTEAKACWRKP